MNCLQCGATIRKGSGFCDECGARVINIEKLAQQMRQQDTQGRDSDNIEGSGDKNIQSNTSRLEGRQAHVQTTNEGTQGRPATAQMTDQTVASRTTNVQATNQGVESRSANTQESNQEIENRNHTEQATESRSENRSNTVQSAGQRDKSRTNNTSSRNKVSSKVPSGARHRELRQPESLGERIRLFITNPLMGITDLEWVMQERSSIKDILFLILLGAIVTTITFNVVPHKLINGLITIFGDFFLVIGNSYISASNADKVAADIMQIPFIQDLGIKAIIYPILSNVILVILMSVMIVGVFRVLRKEDINFRDCLLGMVSSLSVLLVGKIVVGVLALFSGTIAAYVYVVLIALTVFIMIIQIMNIVGISGFTIYCVPLIYIISALVRNTMILGMIKSGMSAYALYF